LEKKKEKDKKKEKSCPIEIECYFLFMEEIYENKYKFIFKLENNESNYIIDLHSLKKNKLNNVEKTIINVKNYLCSTLGNYRLLDISDFTQAKINNTISILEEIKNYITLPNFTLNADDDFEFVCRGNYERVSYSQYFFYSQHFGIYHSDTNTLQFIVVDSGGANKYLNGNFTPGGDFVYVRITKVGNRYTTFASNDGKIWTQLNTSTTITPATTRTSTNNRFGTSSGGYSLFTGEIDLNNTYIKINNKLWFNGQQA